MDDFPTQPALVHHTKRKTRTLHHTMQRGVIDEYKKFCRQRQATAKAAALSLCKTDPPMRVVYGFPVA